LSKLYLTDVIRRQCWDEMLVKGRGLVVGIFIVVCQPLYIDCS